MTKEVVWVVPFLLIWGCATTDDPRQGGLWSYNPAAYERRLEQRRAALHDIQEDQQHEASRAKALESEVALKKVNFQQQTDELNALDAQLARLSQTIDSYQAKIKSESVKKRHIQNEISRLRTMSTNIRGQQDQTQQSEIEKEKSMIALKQDIEKLLNLIILLTP